MICIVCLFFSSDTKLDIFDSRIDAQEFASSSPYPVNIDISSVFSQKPIFTSVISCIEFSGLFLDRTTKVSGIGSKL